MVWGYLFHQVLFGYYLKVYSNGGIYIDVLDLLNSNFYFRWKWNWFYDSNKYTEAIIAFTICILLFGLLYYYLKRNKRKRKADCGDLDCTDCFDCDCTC